MLRVWSAPFKKTMCAAFFFKKKKKLSNVNHLDFTFL